MAGCPPKIRELVERFNLNIEQYKSGRYNEAHVRQEFINPMFKELGWDMDNEQGNAEAYKDVIHEDAIKVGSATKAPDYAFRIGGQRKFFLEAKKPSININEDHEPAYQIRRYAWTAKHPLSILTNFEEFAVYDCRIKPDKNDKASTARVLFLKYTEYEDKWGEIADKFSKEAILKGSFDRFAESSKKKKGTSEVDDAFLEDIENWRNMLAKNIAIRNPKLSQHDLNYAVQSTIDRIIFLRICEDRGIEDYGRLQAEINAEGIYNRLLLLFYKADDKYNSGLFHFKNEKGRESPDELTTDIKIDDKVLKEILVSLYYPDCRYAFSVFPADILGQVYEQFLGKVIRLTAGHQAKVEDKPEVKKAGGVFYTPTFIVDYIIKNTVGKLLEGSSPKKASSIKICDPACGSGSFLLGAYQYLMDWHRDFYVNNGPEKYKKELYKAASGGWRLTIQERKRILLNNIHGVDIDSQAVETTKLSLLLKVLEQETEESLKTNMNLFHERALPDLGGNIKCGNSLIGQDYFDGTMAFLTEDERQSINPFDWHSAFTAVFAGKESGFDAVIGNPPYDVLEKDRTKSTWPHSALSRYIKSNNEYLPALGGKLNLFRFFIIKSLSMVRRDGYYGMIIPLALLGDTSCSRTRLHLIQSSKTLEFECFPQKDNKNKRVFYGAKLSTVIVVSRVDKLSKSNTKMRIRVYPWNRFDDPYLENSLTFSDIEVLDPINLPIPLTDKNNWEVCKKITSLPDVILLGKLKDYSVNRGEINQTIYRKYICTDKKMARLLKGMEVGRYHTRDKFSQGFREWFDEKSFLKSNKAKNNVNERRIAIQRITGVDEKLRIVATIVAPPVYFADSTNSIVINSSSCYSLEYLLALLNSTLFQWRFKITSSNNNVGTNELESLPFRIIKFSDDAEKKKHDKIAYLINSMFSLNKEITEARIDHDKNVLQRQIDATDQQIDKQVYDLYGLTEEEIALVEKSAVKS